MSNLKSRDRFSVKGLGDCQLRRVEPTEETDFVNVGYLEETDFKDIAEIEIIRDENGRVIQALVQSEMVGIDTVLQQTSKDEIDLVKDAKQKIYAMRYYGAASPVMWQYFCIENAVIEPTLNLPFKKGKRLIPMKAIALFKEGTYDIPEYYFVQNVSKIDLQYLRLWLEPILGLNSGTAKILDISGFANHADLQNASIFTDGTSPLKYLTLDGVNDYVQCPIDGKTFTIKTDGIAIGAWINIAGANGSAQEILSIGGKTDGDLEGGTPGLTLVRNASNKLVVTLGDGTDSVQYIGDSSVLINTWHHVKIIITPTNLYLYLDGISEADNVDITALSGAAINLETYPLFIGGYRSSSSAAFGQFKLGAVRLHISPSINAESDIDRYTSHYAAEKAKYGL